VTADDALAATRIAPTNAQKAYRDEVERTRDE
jgi:hypothetical protein